MKGRDCHDPPIPRSPGCVSARFATSSTKRRRHARSRASSVDDRNDARDRLGTSSRRGLLERVERRSISPRSVRRAVSLAECRRGGHHAVASTCRCPSASRITVALEEVRYDLDRVGRWQNMTAVTGALAYRFLKLLRAWFREIQRVTQGFTEAELSPEGRHAMAQLEAASPKLRRRRV